MGTPSATWTPEPISVDFLLSIPEFGGFDNIGTIATKRAARYSQ